MTSIRPKTSHTATTPRFWRRVLALSLVALATGACAKGEESKEQRLARARDYLAAEQYDKAEKEYRGILQLAPDDPVAMRQLGIIYYDQGQPRQAYPLLKQSAERQPDDLDVQLKLGLMYLSSRDYQQARDNAVMILEKQPGHEQGLMLLVDAARTPAELEEARKLIEDVLAKDQARPAYHLALGALDLRQKNEERAENEFNAALKLDPKSSAAHAALGMLFWSRQDLNAAEEAFKAAVDLAAPRSSVWQKYVDFKLRTGAAAEAKATLEDMIRKLPDYLPPRVYLMKIVCGEDNAQGCAANVQNILAQDPVNSEALFQNGSLSLAKGDAQTAVRQFEELGTMYPRSPQVRYQLARAYLLNATTATEVRARILTEAAEKQLIVAIELDPHFDQAILLLAELKMRKGSAAAAVDLLAPLTKERPQIVRAQNLLAAAYLAQQKRDQALAVYRQMTELFPKDPQPPFAIGAILLTQRQQPEARKAFERSAEISPNYLPAVEMLTDLDIADKQYGTAMERIQKLIDNDPNRAQPWALRAKIYLAQRDFKRAEADLLKAIELDPNLVPGYLALAQLYEASNRQEQAIEKLNESMQRNKSVPALTLLAMIQEKQKNFTAARDAYEKLLAMAPNSSLALNNLALLYSEHLGEFDKAYDLAKKAREADPKQPQLADTLGWLLFKKGDYGNALRLLQESSDKLPDSPEIQFHVGMAQYMLGDEGPARVALQKAADASVDFTGKDEARQRLALMAVDVEAGNPGARTELENYLRERPDDPAALVRLARVQVREGAVDRAVKTYEKVVADYPLYAPATRQLAVLYGQSSTDEPKAYELVTKARQVYPADPEIAKTLGILNYRRQYYPQSAELLKEAAAKLKDDPEIAYYLGEVYRQLKQYSECKETLQRALRLNLSPGLAVDARGALAECSDAAP